MRWSDSQGTPWGMLHVGIYTLISITYMNLGFVFSKLLSPIKLCALKVA